MLMHVLVGVGVSMFVRVRDVPVSVLVSMGVAVGVLVNVLMFGVLFHRLFNRQVMDLLKTRRLL